MKNIFLESHNLKNLFSGLGQYNYNLIKELDNINQDLYKFTIISRKNLDVLNIKNKNKFRHKQYFSLHRKIPILKRYDLWHSLNQNTKIEPLFKTPYLLTIHDINFIYEQSRDLNHPRNRRFIKKLNRASAIAYVSNYTKTQTHLYFNVPNVPEYVIYNGNSVTKIDIIKTKQIDLDIPYYYTIGDFLERKNFHILVQMMEHIPNKKLIISGSLKKNYSKKVKQEIEKLNLNDRVILTDKVSDEVKLAYMKGCEAFLFPSENEGFGLPPIEAMSFGKPVFLYRHASLPEIGGNAAFYWENLQVKYMVDKLNKDMSDFKENKKHFQQKIQNRANYFNWERTTKEYLMVYNKLLKLEN